MYVDRRKFGKFLPTYLVSYPRRRGCLWIYDSVHEYVKMINLSLKV